MARKNVKIMTLWCNIVVGPRSPRPLRIRIRPKRHSSARPWRPNGTAPGCVRRGEVHGAFGKVFRWLSIAIDSCRKDGSKPRDDGFLDRAGGFGGFLVAEVGAAGIASRGGVRPGAGFPGCRGIRGSRCSPRIRGLGWGRLWRGVCAWACRIPGTRVRFLGRREWPRGWR